MFYNQVCFSLRERDLAASADTQKHIERKRERENLMDIIDLLRDDSLSLQLELTGISKLSTGGKHAVEVFACVCVCCVTLWTKYGVRFREQMENTRLGIFENILAWTFYSAQIYIMTSKRTSAVAVVNSSFFSLRVIISSDLKQNFLLALSTALPLYFPAVNLSWTCSD